MRALLGLVLVGCGTTKGDGAGGTGDGAGDSGSAGGPTWHQDVAPVVVANCTGCHAPGGVAFDLGDPAAAQALSSVIAGVTAARTMPPWHAVPTADCAPTRPWAHDSRLSDAEIALLAAWDAAGAPLGDAARAAPLEPAVVESLERVDAVVVPAVEYVSAGEADEFWCFSLDPQLTRDTLVTGFEVVPDNREIAHHALLFLDVAAESAALAGDAGGYPCTGGAMTSEAAPLLATWVPGAPPTRAPTGAATEIPAGSRLVLQMHYHPGGRSGVVDETAVHLETTEATGLRGFRQALIGNARNEASGLLPGPGDNGAPRFFIPAEAGAHTEEMVYTLADGIPDLPVVRVGAHMHYVGASLELWAERPGEEPECLLANPGWDFDWQRAYAYDVPLAEAPVVRGGDTLRVRCTYNNTLEHPGTRRALAEEGLDAPVDVGLGEGSLDEMCLAVVSYVL
jgi:hypothetical protein